MTPSGQRPTLGCLARGGGLDLGGWLNRERIKDHQSGPVRPHLVGQFPIPRQAEHQKRRLVRTIIEFPAKRRLAKRLILTRDENLCPRRIRLNRQVKDLKLGRKRGCHDGHRDRHGGRTLQPARPSPKSSPHQQDHARRHPSGLALQQRLASKVEGGGDRRRNHRRQPSHPRQRAGRGRRHRRHRGRACASWVGT